MNFMLSHNGYTIKVFSTDLFSSFTFNSEPSILLTSLLCNLKILLDKLEDVEDVVIGIDSISIFHISNSSKRIQNFIFSNEFDTTPQMETEHVIKVRYNGLDIDYVCDTLGISAQDLITLHTKNTCYIAMMGFLPGFVYIGGGDTRLQLPRKVAPTKLVKAGSVAIAAGFSGIYPVNSPGGWHVIGHTDFINFDLKSASFFKLKVGDKIKFEND